MKAEVINIAGLIVGLFSSNELRILEDVYSNGRRWSFKDQIIDRYASYYPPLNIWAHLKDDLDKRFTAIKSCLDEDNSDTIRELLLDELENTIFVSEQTHLWNQEMLQAKEDETINTPMKWAVDMVMNELEGCFRDADWVEVGLMYRWKSAQFATSKKLFSDFLTLVRLEREGIEDHFDSLDFQEFLIKADEHFLYPRKDRLLRVLMNRDDNGRQTGWKKGMYNLTRSFGLTKIILIFFGIVFVLLIIFFSV